MINIKNFETLKHFVIRETENNPFNKFYQIDRDMEIKMIEYCEQNNMDKALSLVQRVKYYFAMQYMIDRDILETLFGEDDGSILYKELYKMINKLKSDNISNFRIMKAGNKSQTDVYKYLSSQNTTCHKEDMLIICNNTTYSIGFDYTL